MSPVPGCGAIGTPPGRACTDGVLSEGLRSSKSGHSIAAVAGIQSPANCFCDSGVSGHPARLGCISAFARFGRVPEMSISAVRHAASRRAIGPGVNAGPNSASRKKGVNAPHSEIDPCRIAQEPIWARSRLHRRWTAVGRPFYPKQRQSEPPGSGLGAHTGYHIPPIFVQIAPAKVAFVPRMTI